jgi:hypothetical protein
VANTACLLLGPSGYPHPSRYFVCNRSLILHIRIHNITVIILCFALQKPERDERDTEIDRLEMDNQFLKDLLQKVRECIEHVVHLNTQLLYMGLFIFGDADYCRQRLSVNLSSPS